MKGSSFVKEFVVDKPVDKPVDKIPARWWRVEFVPLSLLVVIFGLLVTWPDSPPAVVVPEDPRVRHIYIDRPHLPPVVCDTIPGHYAVWDCVEVVQ